MWLATTKLLLAWALVNGLLLAPVWLHGAYGGGTAAGPAAWIALDGTLLVGLLALLPARRWTRALAWAAAAGLLLLTVVALADVGFRLGLGRPLNLFIDLYLVDAVRRLAVGNVGVAKTLGLVAAGGGVLALLALALAWLLTPVAERAPGDGAFGDAERPARGEVREASPTPGGRGVQTHRLGGAALVALALVGFTTRQIRRAEPDPAGDDPALVERGAVAHLAAPALALLREQAGLFRTTRAERGRFAGEMAAAPDSYADTPGLLDGLAGTDVLLTFIESYGMAALDDPAWAAVVRPRLDEMAERLGVAGLHVASGSLSSPTVGGQSWYAHGTVVSGLWLENQLRYDLLLASDRETLVDDFRHAGHETVALMPAITTAWPEGVRLGYDRIYTRPDIPYGGPPLYWVTMPDQFTLSFLEQIRREARGRPLFVEAALVSSHSPWTPILPVLDWDEVGDGSVFATFERQGHPPEELWVDPDKLREDYPRSLAYSLGTVTGFAERHVDDGTLFIVLGDHQPLAWVMREGMDRSVPVHVISGDPALVEPFLAWGFRPGGVPDPHGEPRRMDEFRGWFVRAFSDRPADPEEKAHRDGGP